MSDRTRHSGLAITHKSIHRLSQIPRQDSDVPRSELVGKNHLSVIVVLTNAPIISLGAKQSMQEKD